MNVDGKPYRTVWANGSSVFLIEQNLLPFEFRIAECRTFRETCRAIKIMTVRGAGAIGATAAFAMAQAFIEASKDTFWTFVENAKNEINSTRPTAQNLFYATARVFDAAKRADDCAKAVQIAITEARQIADEDAENCRRIGEYGAVLVKDGFSIETHCNAGWLAFVDYGSALSPIYAAHRSGKSVFVYADETRPRGQGARLTAWELKNEGVPHAIIPDNAGAWYMSQGKINMMIVGADRIAANGDTANKIGTLEKAIAAKEFGVPFYVAAPTSTFDMACKSGSDIPIEERSEDEVLYQTGPVRRRRLFAPKLETILVASPGSKAVNPSFDVTPARLITGIITEKGIVRPNENDIRKLFE